MATWGCWALQGPTSERTNPPPTHWDLRMAGCLWKVPAWLRGRGERRVWRLPPQHSALTSSASQWCSSPTHPHLERRAQAVREPAGGCQGRPRLAQLPALLEAEPAPPRLIASRDGTCGWAWQAAEPPGLWLAGPQWSRQLRHPKSPQVFASHKLHSPLWPSTACLSPGALAEV